MKGLHQQDESVSLNDKIKNFEMESHETLIRERRQHPSEGAPLVPLVISDSKSSQGRILRR